MNSHFHSQIFHILLFTIFFFKMELENVNLSFYHDKIQAIYFFNFQLKILRSSLSNFF